MLIMKIIIIIIVKSFWKRRPIKFLIIISTCSTGVTTQIFSHGFLWDFGVPIKIHFF